MVVIVNVREKSTFAADTGLLLNNAAAPVGSVVMTAMGVLTFLRRDHRNILPADTDPGSWGGRFFDEQTGRVVSYRITRMPLAIVTSFAAGTISTLLGLGGGVAAGEGLCRSEVDRVCQRPPERIEVVGGGEAFRHVGNAEAESVLRGGEGLEDVEGGGQPLD